MACDHSSIIIIIIIITATTTTTTTTTTALYFSQKWNYNEIRKRIIMNRHSCITLEPRGWRNCFWAIPLWIIISVYMIICCLWIIGWKSIGHCAVSVAILVATCRLRLPVVPSSVDELNQAAQQSADCSLSYQKRNDLTHYFRFWLFFALFLFLQRLSWIPRLFYCSCW